MRFSAMPIRTFFTNKKPKHSARWRVRNNALRHKMQMLQATWCWNLCQSLHDTRTSTSVLRNSAAASQQHVKMLQDNTFLGPVLCSCLVWMLCVHSNWPWEEASRKVFWLIDQVHHLFLENTWTVLHLPPFSTESKYSVLFIFCVMEKNLRSTSWVCVKRDRSTPELIACITLTCGLSVCCHPFTHSLGLFSFTTLTEKICLRFPKFKVRVLLRVPSVSHTVEWDNREIVVRVTFCRWPKCSCTVVPA